MLIVGRLSDVVGRRWFIIGGQVFAIVGSTISATAKSVNVVITGAAFTGIAGGTQQLYPLLVHELVPNKYPSPLYGCSVFRKHLEGVNGDLGPWPGLTTPTVAILSS